MTDVLLERSIVQLPVPLQPPPQPWKAELAPGAAVSVTWVPLLKVAVQVCPHSIPAGSLLIIPVPFPLAWTVS